MSNNVSIDFSESSIERLQRLRGELTEVAGAHCGSITAGAHCGSITAGAHCGSITAGANFG